MTYTFNPHYFKQRDSYLDAIYAVLERGMAEKEVVCSITTGFRSMHP